MKLSEFNREDKVYLHWVKKAHTWTMGNEIADKAANRAHNNDRTELLIYTKLNTTAYWRKSSFTLVMNTGKQMYSSPI